MDDSHVSRNRTILSQSYMERVKRLSGNPTTSEEEYKISEEKIKSREKSWSWLFKKFSKFPDVGILNILTLQPDTESSGSHVSEIKLPVRKSTRQLQHWIDTGNSPWQAMEMEISDTDKTVSISESETADSENSESLHSRSMIANQVLVNSREQLIATGSSASSVDTATYIIQNGKSGRKNKKDGPRNVDNHIVARSINAAVPRVLCIRLTDWPKKAQNDDKNSADVDEGSSNRSRVASEDDIVSDQNNSHQISVKKSKNDEIKDSEVTFESKESGIGSSGVENTEKGGSRGDKKSSSSSDGIVLSPNKSVSLGRRKLFTQSNDLADLVTPTVKTVTQMKSIRKSFHPAFDSPSTCGKSKSKIRPRLLTMSRRKFRSYSIMKRNRNKSMLSKSRVFKNNRLSSEGDERAAENSIENGISPGNENLDTLTKISALSPNEIKKNGNSSKGKSPDTSSSLSSKDVSLIINEEWNKTLETLTAVVPKNSQQSYVRDVQKSENKECGNDQGSIFKPPAQSSDETKESKLRSMRRVKKNLCATELQSSGDTDSPSASSSDVWTKNDEDSISNASTILLPNSRRRKRNLKTVKNDLNYEKIKDSAQFNPIVILHDFLDLKNCCGELEKENNENWFREQNEKENLKRDRKGDDEKVNSDAKNMENIKSKKAMNQKVPVRKKLKLENKVASSKRDGGRILRNRNTAFIVTDDSQSSGEMPLCLRIQRPDYDRNHRSATGSNCSQDLEPNERLPNGGNATITFTNTNHNRWESIFVLTSSDEEDPFKKLHNRSKKRPPRKESGVNHDGVAPSTSVTKNGTLDGSGGTKSYRIVSSSSEDGKNRLSTRSATSSKRVTRRYSKRNKPEDSRDSELTMRCFREDECGDRSEGFKIMNEKLEEQSPGVNSRRSERKIGKQPLETSGDYLVAQSKVNDETRTDRKSRSKEKARMNGDKSEVKISCSRTKLVDKVMIAEKINDKENSPGRKNISEKLINQPVDRVSNSPKIHTGVKDAAGEKRDTTIIEKSRTSSKRKSSRKIQRVIESSESGDRSEVGRTPDHKDRRKSSVNIDESDESSGKGGGETSASSNVFKLVFDDESSDNDDGITFHSVNYAGDDSRDKKITLKNGGPDSSDNKRRSNLKGDAPSFSKKNRNRHRRTSSKIVFRTKEYWETDSDNTLFI